MQARPAFNDVELSFLELSKGRNLTTEDAIALKTLWARYFLEKATHSADIAWKKKKYTRETMNKLVKGAK